MNHIIKYNNFNKNNKYLKLNEGKTQLEMKLQFINEIKLFCEELLAYLVDLGCIVRFADIPFNLAVVLYFENSMSWDKIEQYILPFYEILRETYYLNNEGIIELKSESDFSDIDLESGKLLGYRGNAMNDNAKLLDSITSIRIKLDYSKVYGKFDYEGLKR